MPLSAEEVARLESAARAIRTKMQIFRSELDLMRKLANIEDPDMDRMVPVKSDKVPPEKLQKYLARKADYLWAKTEEEEIKSRLSFR